MEKHDSSGSVPLGRDELTAILKREGLRLGFELVGVAPAVTPTGLSRLHDWLDRGFAGEMGYLARRADAYTHPQSVLDGVRSVIMVALNYKPAPVSAESIASPPELAGRVAAYARGPRDYHDILKERLQELAQILHTHTPGCRTRCVVDTAPLLERDFARLSGLGWFGKNTMLIHKRLGSFIFLGGLLTDVELTFDQPHETSHCGTCTRCLEVCPTDAFPEPGVLDARRCISYLTIELKGPIPTEHRAGIGDWLFGCDLCQDVCPWNRKSPSSRDPEFVPLTDLAPADASELLQAADEELKRRFRKSPLSRTGAVGLKRNAAIVLGNLGDIAAIPALMTGLAHADPVVRGACAWGLGQLPSAAARAALQAHCRIEENPQVLEELEAALAEPTSGVFPRDSASDQQPHQE